MATQTMDSNMIHSRTKAQTHRHTGLKHYGRFAAMVGLSFIAMYILMYAMVNSFSSVFNSINQVYMAGLMAAPMAVIEILLMNKMYPNKKINTIILVGSVVALVFFWMGIRNQIGVNDQQFLRSMIPHHSGAILMCNEAQLSNPEIKNLCANIVKSQQEEIDQMKALLSK